MCGEYMDGLVVGRQAALRGDAGAACRADQSATAFSITTSSRGTSS